MKKELGVIKHFLYLINAMFHFDVGFLAVDALHNFFLKKSSSIISLSQFILRHF